MAGGYQPGYTSEERSKNAAKQSRDVLGMWADESKDATAMIDGQELEGMLVGLDLSDPSGQTVIFMDSTGKQHSVHRSNLNVSDMSALSDNKAALWRKVTKAYEKAQEEKNAGRGGGSGGGSGSADTEAAKKETRANSLEARIKTAERQLADARDRAEQAQDKINLAKQKGAIAITAAQDSMEKAKADSKKRHERAIENLTAGQEKLDEASAELEKAKKDFEEASKQFNNADPDQAPIFRAKLERARRALNAATGSVDSARKSVTSLEDTAEDNESDLDEVAVRAKRAYDAAVADVNMAISRAESSGRSAERRVKNLEDDIASMKEDLKALRSSGVDVVRLARDGSGFIAKSDDVYISIRNGEKRVGSSLEALTAAGGWRRVSDKDRAHYAERAIVAAGKIYEAPVEPKPIVQKRLLRVPPTIKSNIGSALNKYGAILGAEDQATAKRLAHNTHVDQSDVEWMLDFFDRMEKAVELHGGPRGHSWARKVIESAKAMDEQGAPITAAADISWRVFDQETNNPNILFVAGSDDPEGMVFDSLYMIETFPGARYPEHEVIVYEWDEDEFEATNYDGSSLNREHLIELDHETARRLAELLGKYEDEIEEFRGFSVVDFYPMERNLFDLAQEEEAALIADALHNTDGYTAAERSENAHRQPRGAGGRFSGGGPEKKSETIQGLKKATLPAELPLVEDPAALVREYMETSAPVSAGLDDSALTAAAEGTPEPLYLAVVDDLDRTAVMDVFALLNINGEPAAYRRSDGVWVADETFVENIQGLTPPPMVQLEEPELIKNVLSQVDESDGASDLNPTEDQAKMDQGRDDTVYAGDMFGAYGEIIAAGVPGIADTPSDMSAVARLKRYWAFGEGAAKINWGLEKGNLTRCHNHLVKYLKSSDRAWGYCQEIHKMALGRHNPESGRKG